MRTMGVARDKSMCRHHWSRGVRGMLSRKHPISPQLHFRTF